MPPSETKQATERNKISAWRRASEPALKAFGIGAFAGIAGAYRVQSDFSLPERILFALCCAALGGLLCVVPTYLVAVLSNTRREPTTTIRTANRKRSEGVVNLILPGIIGLAYVFWLFGKSQETRETHQLEEVSAPAQTEKASAPDGQVFERQPIVSSAKDEPWPDNQAQAAAEFEKEFFVRYPDLRPYKAIVDAVALKLQEGGYKPENRESIMETYAKAAREEVASRQQIQNAPVLKDETLPSAEASPADSPAVEETPGSQFILGSRYLRGEGVEQDYVKAAYWFRKAAEQDDPRAQNNIGVMFQTGRGVRRDDTLAYAWFSIAAQQGDTNAMRNRDELTGSLSQAQLAEARRRAATLIPLKSNPK
jgi:hypothetical protein